MVGTVIILTIMVVTIVLGRYVIKLGLEAQKNKMQHNRHYNSLDENSTYSERPCKGKRCDCRCKEKKLTIGPSGKEENWSSGDM